MVVQPDVASESHAHWCGFCRLEAPKGHVKHKIQHEIRTGSVQSCREAQQAPYSHPVRPHYREEYSPSWAA